MASFNFEIKPKEFTVIKGMVEEIADTIREGLAIELDFPEEDEALEESWKESLMECLQSDCENLLFLIGHESFLKRPIPIDIEFGEAIIRACSAMRLKLRNSLLKGIPNHELESNELDVDKLNIELQLPYACYAFLASLQEKLVKIIEKAKA